MTSFSRGVVAGSEGFSPVSGVSYEVADLSVSIPDLTGVDVVVAALSPRGSSVDALRGAYQDLAKEAASTGTRLVVIGGFSSLRPTEGAPRFVESGQIPADYRVEANVMNSTLTDLLTDAAGGDWVFISPAAEFGGFNPGEKLGHYRVSGEVALFDSEGKSAISGADFATGVVDEIETPSVRARHIGFAY